jgi:hypothetical protein
MMIFEDRVLRRLFGAKRGEDWRRLHKKELYALYSSPNIIWVIKSRIMSWAGDVACMGKRETAYRVLVGKFEGRKSLERPEHKWEDSIKMNLRDVGCGDIDKIDVSTLGTGGGSL